jgi:phage FluMu protein Com
MLHMTCSHCDGLIKSLFLVELQEIECPQCKEIVTVKNVVVSTKEFTMQREDLINRISHYKKLLRDVEKDIAQGDGKENNTDSARKSSDTLRASLKELLLAARDNFRLNMSYDLYVQINFGINKRLAKLVNISATGAAIVLVDRGPVPENNSAIKFQLLLPGSQESLSFSVTVVWSKKLSSGKFSDSITMGVKFQDLDQETRECICDFIVTSETSGHA